MQFPYAMFCLLCICGIKIPVNVQFRLSVQNSGDKIPPALYIYI